VKTPHFLRALSSRNYRLYFIGQCVSLLGNWMTSTAAMWLVYRMSGSSFDVGLIFFANQVPVLLLAPLAGVGIDRLNGLKIVQLTQFLGMCQSAALAIFTFTGHMTVPALLWLTLWQGFINALDFPARQTLTYHLAGDPAHLDNVIALNSVTFNLARLVGPAIAGFVIAAGGAGVCFTVDAISYLAVLAALFAVRLAPRAARGSQAHPLSDLREGVRYCWTHPKVRRPLLLVPVIALFGFAGTILAPVFAETVLHGDARTLGFLMAATGVGAVLSGFFLTTRRSADGLPRLIATGAALGGVGLGVIGSSHTIALSLIGFAAAGGGGAMVMVATNTLIQSSIHDEKRGRVMSLFTMGQGFFPLGSLLVGWVAALVGPRWTVAACGLLCLAAAALYLRTERRAHGRHEPLAGGVPTA
jgi:MFS family permease